MFRSASVCSDERKIDICALSRGQCDLRFLCFFLEALKCHLVSAKVHTLLLLEVFNKEVDQRAIPVITTEVCVTVRCLHFENTVADFEDRYVECATTKVIHRDHFVLTFIKTISEGRSSRFVDDTLHFETSDLASILSCLALRVIEVSRNSDHSLCNCFAEVGFGVRFKLLQDHRRNLLWSELLLLALNLTLDVSVAVLALNDVVREALRLFLYFVELTSDEALRREDRVTRICDSLAFSSLPYETFAIFSESHNRRSGACTLRIWYDNRFPAFHYGHARVSRA